MRNGVKEFGSSGEEKERKMSAIEIRFDEYFDIVRFHVELLLGIEWLNFRHGEPIGEAKKISSWKRLRELRSDLKDDTRFGDAIARSITLSKSFWISDASDEIGWQILVHGDDDHRSRAQQAFAEFRSSQDPLMLLDALWHIVNKVDVSTSSCLPPAFQAEFDQLPELNESDASDRQEGTKSRRFGVN